MKTKLSLIALVLIASVGVASAQNTAVKEVKAEKEKTCCSDKKQNTVTTKKDSKTCNCEGVKTAEGKAVQKQECKKNECKGSCDKKDQKCCAANADKKDQKCCAANADKKDQKCCTTATDKKEQKNTKTADKKEKCTGNCEECEETK